MNILTDDDYLSERELGWLEGNVLARDIRMNSLLLEFLSFERLKFIEILWIENDSIFDFSKIIFQI